LLPFPGLDGWSLLVLAVEGISKKKMPTKVKNIISFVGLIILFAFMGLVLLKDVIGLF
jgi:regulator of sigma E protease